jgi:hypothetical protein
VKINNAQNNKGWKRIEYKGGMQSIWENEWGMKVKIVCDMTLVVWRVRKGARSNQFTHKARIF